MKKVKRSYLRRDWKLVLEEYSASGLSVSEYCKSKDINKYLFLRWQQRLAGRDDEKVASSEYTLADFVQFPVVANPSLSIRFPNGVELIVSKHYDLEYLREIMVHLKGILC